MNPDLESKNENPSDANIEETEPAVESRITEGMELIGDKDEFYKKTKEILLKFADESYKDYLKLQVPDLKNFYGTPVPVLRILSRAVGKFVMKNPGEGKALLKRLWQEENREERKIAGESLAFLFEADPDSALTLALEFIPDIDNWELCDTLAGLGLKPYILNQTDIAIKQIKSFLRSPNPWIRRLGLVTLIPLANYGHVEDLDVYFILLKMVMKDPDENVQKAVSWVMREITPRDPHRVAKFMEVFAVQPSQETRRIIREGSKKLNPTVRYKLMELMKK